MKATINGRRYNTEAPLTRKIAERSEGYATDLHGYFEELFRTGHGSWFLAGSGGALTRYHGERIIPISNQEARAWLEQADETDALEEHFLDQIEDA